MKECRTIQKGVQEDPKPVELRSQDYTGTRNPSRTLPTPQPSNYLNDSRSRPSTIDCPSQQTHGTGIFRYSSRGQWLERINCTRLPSAGSPPRFMGKKEGPSETPPAPHPMALSSPPGTNHSKLEKGNVEAFYLRTQQNSSACQS